MIDIKYKKIYAEFIKKYEEIHVNPWHEINKEELSSIYNNLVNSMNITNEYSFKYLMDYIIKRLSGSEDAHTKYRCTNPIQFIIPFNFRKFGDEILVNYPDNLRGYNLTSINEISIDNVIGELENVITYGTEGKRNDEIEKALLNRLQMFTLPSFRETDKLVYEFKDNNDNTINNTIAKEEVYDNLFDYNKYINGDNTVYRFIDNCLIYNHSSVQNKFKDIIEGSIKRLETEDLSNIDTIIIDLRGNWGGNSALNKPLMDYLKTQTDKKLICLTDYRIFSAGRYALRDLINLGATTIGEEIGTPINCYGESNWINIDEHYFTISECYFHPLINLSISSKEEFKEKVTEDVRKPYIFHPDIEVKQTKEDYLNGIDTVLEYALGYSKSKKNK